MPPWCWLAGPRPHEHWSSVSHLRRWRRPLGDCSDHRRKAKAGMNRFSRNADFSYAWVVAAVSFITLLAAAGFRSTPGVLFLPLEGEFGWSRATVGIAVSVNLLLFGFVGP